eukprot:scaffold93832_cov31-Tisochrysis_lutea.AAC.4
MAVHAHPDNMLHGWSMITVRAWGNRTPPYMMGVFHQSALPRGKASTDYIKGSMALGARRCQLIPLSNCTGCRCLFGRSRRYFNWPRSEILRFDH